MTEIEKKNKLPKADPIMFGGFDAVAEIANKLIPKYHPHLATAKFLFCSRNKAQKQGGVPVPGTVKKASPLEKYLGSHILPNDDEPDFIMIIALSLWNDMNPNQRTAFIDHLLMRCGAEDEDESGDIKYSIHPPEVQEFSEIVSRHGNWNISLQNLCHEIEHKK
jgi:hypothetical protein